MAYPSDPVENRGTSIPKAQADYALRLLEKGYSILDLAQLIGVSMEEMTRAIEEAIQRR